MSRLFCILETLSLEHAIAPERSSAIAAGPLRTSLALILVFTSGACGLVWQMLWTAGFGVALGHEVIAVLAVCYRPLLFATADPEVAAARGVPVRAMGIVFAALVGVVAAQGVQIVGALLVMSLLITPAAAAARVFSSPVATIAASVVFAELAAVGGIVASLAPGVPISVFVTTISFVIYLVCWAISRRHHDPAAA